MIKNEIRSDFEKGGLRSKRLRRDSTSEVVAVCEPSKSTQTFLAEKSAGSGAAKSLSFNLPPSLSLQLYLNRELWLKRALELV